MFNDSAAIQMFHLVGWRVVSVLSVKGSSLLFSVVLDFEIDVSSFGSATRLRQRLRYLNKLRFFLFFSFSVALNRTASEARNSGALRLRLM